MYCRKSSDAEDRQVQSIPDQIRELKELAAENSIEVVEVFQESKSAKAPGRKVFTEMINRINKGEANGLIVWKINRLARNPIDGGTISWMLQQGVIQHIQTYGRSYYPDDNVLMMSVELGMANQYVRDLSTDTKRGIRAREENGLPNGVAPIGFLNDLSAEPGNRGWIVDEERFPLIKQMLELYLTGKYSVRTLTRVANEEMGLRTPLHKKQGGKKFVISYTCDTILKNTVYAGFFYSKTGERHELHPDLPRMITEDKYWQIQKILGNKGRPRPIRITFSYTGRMTCGSCGGGVTAEHKHQLICPECRKKFAYPNKTHCPGCEIAIAKMENPTYLHYVYYHCTKKKNPDCSEGSIREEDIDGYLASHFRERMRISKSLAEWCVKNLAALEESEKQNEFERKESLGNTIAKKETEYKELALMKARGQLSDTEFIEIKGPLREEIEALKRELAALGHVDQNRLKDAYKAFEMALGLDEIFRNGSIEDKKDALSETGSNLTLKDKKLNVSHKKLYEAIMSGLLTAREENKRFEPENCEAEKDKTEVFASVRPTLLPG